MNYEIEFFNDSVYKETMNLPSSILAQLLRVFDLAEIYGANLGRPHSAPLGDGLFEFRAKGKEGIARSIFVCVAGRKIIILHSITKKSSKIPRKDFRISKETSKGVKMKSYKEFKKEALAKSEVKAIYESLSDEFELKAKLIELRKSAKLTQEELAKRMHTTKSSIARLESLKSNPTIATLQSYANAFGKSLRIEFV